MFGAFKIEMSPLNELDSESDCVGGCGGDVPSGREFGEVVRVPRVLIALPARKGPDGY
jgi:hypothetical protein